MTLFHRSVDLIFASWPSSTFTLYCGHKQTLFPVRGRSTLFQATSRGACECCLMIDDGTVFFLWAMLINKTCTWKIIKVKHIFHQRRVNIWCVRSRTTSWTRRSEKRRKKNKQFTYLLTIEWKIHHRIDGFSVAALCVYQEPFHSVQCNRSRGRPTIIAFTMKCALRTLLIEKPLSAFQLRVMPRWKCLPSS